MLRTELIHPEILGVLAAAGHGSTVLIADGNYPTSTCMGPRAKRVSLNLSPGIVNCAEVLRAVLTAIPIEAVQVMQPDGATRPKVWAEFESILDKAQCNLALQAIDRFEFYRAASTDQHALTIQTGEQRVYANVLLTIGVRRE